MINEKYTIEVGEGCVEIHGRLSIDEGLVLLNLFQKQGFNEIFWGSENSALRLTKNHDQDKKVENLEDLNKTIDSLKQELKQKNDHIIILNNINKHLRKLIEHDWNTNSF